MSFFKSDRTLYDFDAKVLLNVYNYLLFVGEGWLALVPSHLPHLTDLILIECNSVCDKYVEELRPALPQLHVIK